MKMSYQSPQLELTELEVEQGIAQSGVFIIDLSNEVVYEDEF